MNEPENRDLIIGQQFPSLASECDEAASAGFELARIKDALHGDKPRDSKGDNPALPESELRCVCCRQEKPFNYTVRIDGQEIFGVCDDCDDYGDGMKSALLLATCMGISHQAHRYCQDRAALVAEIARLSEARDEAQRTKEGLAKQWDAAALEVTRLRKECRKRGRWLIVLAIALGCAAAWMVMR